MMISFNLIGFQARFGLTDWLDVGRWSLVWPLM